MIRISHLAFVLSLTLLVSGLVAQSAGEARSTLKEWIQLEKTYSAEKSEWDAESQIIEDQINLLKSEKARLEEKIGEAESAVDKAKSKRSELNSRKEELVAAVDTLKGPLQVLEERIHELYPQLPPPLQEEISKLYARVPKEAENARLSTSERLQAVIGILSQADKFNSGVQKETEIRSIGDRQAEVETLYFGLAGAYFADSQGTYAGIGYPTGNGWEWEEKPDAAARIARLVAVYDGTQEASFTMLPVEIK